MTPSNTLPCLKVPCFIGWGFRGTATPLALGNPKGGAALADGIQWRAEPFLAESIRENRGLVVHDFAVGIPMQPAAWGRC